jgi:hypothetical protein
MSLPSTSFANLLIVAVPIIAACSFDANRLRAQPHKDAESPFDQGSADGGTTGTAPDVSPASTSPLDGGGAQDTPPVGEDVRVSNDVAASGGAAGALDGGGGSGGTVAFDGPTAVPLDAIGTGGTMSTGGTTNSGGTTSTGGTTNSGGTTSTGGTTNTGGTTSTGGSTSPSVYCTTYTDLGTLPSTSTEQTIVPAAETCFRFAVAAAGEMLRGIQMSNCGTRTLTINSTDSGCTPVSNCSVAVSIARAADGFWYLQFSATTGTNCSSTWWWYP